MMLAVPLPNPIPELPISPRAAELFDPGVFVRRNALRGELPSNPKRLFRQDHTVTQGRRRHRRRTPSGASADDEDVAVHGLIWTVLVSV